MKKLLSILFLFISIATFSQTKLTAPVVRNIPADTSYPTHIDSLGKGGWIAFSDIASRDALPFSSRKIGMVATVDADVYMLLGGYGNVNWSRVYFSAIGTVDSITAPYPYSQYIAWSNASQLFSFPTFLKKVYGEGNIVVDSTGVDSIRIRCINCGTVQNGRISGLIVSYDTLYRYYITAGIGVINQAQYTSVQSSVTLQPADVSFDRIDVIADSLGTIVVKTGVAAASPQEPQIDPATEIALTFVTVYANTTAPPGVTVTPIYDEQFPAEWGTSVTSGLTVNFANTVTSFHLLKAADVGTWATTKLITFTSPTTINRNDISLLKMYINLKAPLVSTANIQAYFYNGTTVVGLVTLTAAQGFSKTVTGYQNITVPLSSLAFTGTNFNKVAIRFTGVGSGIYLDYVQLQGGVPQPTTGGITGLYRIQGRDSIYWKDANGNQQAIKDSLLNGYVSINQLNDTTLVFVKQDGTQDTVSISNNAGSGSVTSVTASLPLSITGTPTVNPNVVADTTSGTATSLVTQYQRTKTKDSLQTNINLKVNTADSVSGVATNYVTQYQRKKTSDSLLALINTKLNITDTGFLHGRAVLSFAINGTADSAILTLYGGARYAVKTGSAGTTYTANTPITLTGSAFGADTSAVATALVTQYQRKKTSDSLLALINLRFLITDTANKWVQFAGLNATGDSMYVVKNGSRTASKINAASSGWNLTGSAGTTAANYAGTSDNKSFRLGANGVVAGIIDSATQNWNIGTTSNAGYRMQITSSAANSFNGLNITGSGINLGLAGLLRFNPSGAGGSAFIDVGNDINGTLGIRANTMSLTTTLLTGTALWTNSRSINIGASGGASGAGASYLYNGISVIVQRLDSNMLFINNNTQFKNLSLAGSLGVIITDDVTNPNLYNHNNSAVFEVTTVNNKGSLPAPRITSTVKGNIILTGVAKYTFTSGTGYNSGTFPVLSTSGGTGTGLTLNVRVSAGAVDLVNVVNAGTGYSINDVITIPSIGAGSGFGLTVKGLTGEGGLLVIDTTQKIMNEYNGAGWNMHAMWGYVAKTSTYTATLNDYTIDCTSGTFSVNLPASSGLAGRVYIIKNSGTGIITIDGNSSETIDGSATKTLSTQYSGYMIQSDNVNWKIISTF